MGSKRARALVVLSVLAVAAAGAPACKPRGHRAKRSEPIVEQDLRFSLRAPSDDWRLLSRSEIRGITPDAVAGMQHTKTGVYGAIIVEQIPGVKLDATSAQIRGNLKLDGQKQTPMEPATVSGKEARRWRTTGSLNGVPVRFEHTLFLHQDHLYQLVAWGPLASTDADGSSFRPFVDAFSLLDGKVRSPTAAPSADRAGVGWRVHGGRYENAPYGVVVTAPEGWRVVVRPELAQMNDNALVGLQRSAPDAYLAVIVERAPGKIGPAIAQKVLHDTAANYGSRVGKNTAAVTVDGQKMVAQVHPGPEGVAGEVLQTVLLREGLAVQILGWYAGQKDDPARAATVVGFSSVHVLPPAERAKLAAELGHTPDPASLIGQTFAYRGDVYRNFKRHFMLRRTAAWELDVEASSRGDSEELVLPVENPEAGLAGELRVLPVGARDGASFHKDQVVKRFGHALGAPVDMLLAGRPALETRAFTPTTPPLTHVLTTAVHGRWGFSLRLYGIPENVDGAQTAIDELRSALVFDDASLAEAADSGGAFVDWRMGYRMRLPGSGWQRRDVTPATVAAITSVQSWTKLGYEVVMSVMPAPDGQAEAIEAQAERQGDRFLADDYSRRSGHIAGQRAKILASSSGLLEKRAVMLRRRGVFYLLLASWPRLGAGAFEHDLGAGIELLD